MRPVTLLFSLFPGMPLRTESVRFLHTYADYISAYYAGVNGQALWYLPYELPHYFVWFAYDPAEGYVNEVLSWIQ